MPVSCPFRTETLTLMNLNIGPITEGQIPKGPREAVPVIANRTFSI
jgi:hypothetical protein